MTTIEGVIAAARTDGASAVLTIFPLTSLPDRRIDPGNPFDLTVSRDEWQSDDGLREYVDHIVGRCGRIEYEDGLLGRRLAGFRTI